LSGLGLALAAAAAAAPTLVLPPTGPNDAARAWVAEAVANDLPRALRELGVPVVDDADRRRAHEVLQIPLVRLTRATSVRIAEALGAARMVTGTWQASSGRLSLALRMLDVERGTLSAPLRADGPEEALPQLLRNLAWDIALASETPPAGTREEFLRRASKVPFEAYRLLGRGLAGPDAATRRRFLRQAIALHPGYDAARVELGRLQVTARDGALAADNLARVSASSPVAREARFLQGVALLDIGRYQEAAALYAALARSDASGAVLNNYALALLRAGQPTSAPRASEVLKQALHGAKGAPEIPFNVGFALFLEGDAEAAAFWMRGVLRESPEDAHARVVLCWALRRTGREADADAEWRPLVAVAPAFESLRDPEPERRFERVLLWERPLAVDEAEWGNPQFAASHLGRAEKLTEAGDLEAAERELVQAAYLDPYGDRAHVLLARMHRRRGDRDKAASELRMALWLKDDAPVRLELAGLLKEMGRDGEARSEAQRVLKLLPGNAEALILSGKSPKH
jgi:tetratricopeptide (TPR) repeat protein